MMLLFKAWIESRTRFLAGLVAVAGECLLYLHWHTFQIGMWISLLHQHPTQKYPFWLSLSTRDYNCYLWVFLYDNYLQQVWVLFAVLLALGGLARERSNGSATFTLSLPVSRAKWLWTRLFVAAAESFALALFAIPVIVLGSIPLHQSYSVTQLFAHSLLMATGGMLFLAAGNLCFSIFPRENYALILTIVLLGVPYLLIQSWTWHQRIAGRTTWGNYLDAAHVMGGPWHLTWANVPWAGLLTLCLLTAAFIWPATHYGERIDY